MPGDAFFVTGNQGRFKVWLPVFVGSPCHVRVVLEWDELGL